MTNQKLKVEVRKYKPITLHHEGFEIVEVIHRVCRAEAVGNFNPVFCTYKGEKKQVHSDAGDISDPFRREQSYLNSLYIKI